MGSKLNSLTDVLKKTLFFFETLSVEELVPYVKSKMMQDYTITQIEENINLCLKQHSCFYQDSIGLWRLDLEGQRENDHFYSLLLKRQMPLSLKEIFRDGGAKKKKVRKLISEEAGLMSDGRFVQLDNGQWGLTEWEVETGNYSFKQLVVRALKLHPGGLSVHQLYQVVNAWRTTTVQAVEGILRKFPYFEEMGEGIWCYNGVAQVIYEQILKRYLDLIKRQKARRQRERERLYKKFETLKCQLEEVKAAHHQAASALAERMEVEEQYEQLFTQVTEKDLLLSLRKKEILRYREHLAKLEAKANGILHQCRLWVKRARESEAENLRLKEIINKNQGSLETLFTKLHQYKERDRESKSRLSELKEKYSDKIAELQTEIIELKQKMERSQEQAGQIEKRLHEEIIFLNNDLKDALERAEELEKTNRVLRQDVLRAKEEKMDLEGTLRHPLLRMALKIIGFFQRQSKEVNSGG